MIGYHRKLFQSILQFGDYIGAMLTRLRASKISGIMVVMIVAAALRIIYLASYAELPDWSQLTVDNYYHHNWAQVLASGDLIGDTTYFRAPFYIYCLAVLYALLGASLWVGRIFGVVVGLGSVLATYFLGRRVFNPRIGLAAAAIHAVWPTMLFFEGELLLDPLFALLMQVGILMWLKWRDSDLMRDLVLSGMAIGLACITRPTGLVVLALMMVWTLFVRPNGLKNGLRTIILLASATIFIAPITIRNLAVADDPVMIASQGGINFFIGNHATADGLSASMPEPYGHNWRMRDIKYIAEQAAGPDLKPGEISTYWYGQAWDWIGAHPAQAAQLYLEKLYRFVSNDEVSNNRSMTLFFEKIPLLRYNLLSFATVFSFAVVGALLGIRTNRKVLVLTGIVAIYILAGALFFFSSRFRLPVMPFLFVLAAGGAGGLLERAIGRSASVVGGLLVLIPVWLFSYLPVVALPPGMSAMGHVSAGLHYYHRGDLETARDLLLQARAADSTFPEVNLNLGVTYLKLGMVDSARHYLYLEQAANPGRPKTYVNLSSIALVEGRLDSAAIVLQPALASFPYDVTTRRLQLRIAEARLIDRDSLYHLARSAALATGHDGVLLMEAATMLTNRGDLVQARQLLRLALEASPRSVETDDRMFEPDYPLALRQDQIQAALVEYQLGYVEALTGDYRSSVAHSRRAIALDSSMVEAHVNLISSLLALGDRVQAVSALEDAERRFPDDPNLNRLGRNLRESLR
jgi:4-amino-4-deoxy-L-arabinose transferase-like glycosyltransferase